MIEITPAVSIAEDEVVCRAVRASGPGGQHVNKTSSAIELRFDVRNSPNLPEGLKTRLEKLAGSRLTADGVIVIFAQNHREQGMNRMDALERLTDLIRKASVAPKKRRPTKPTLGSKLRRVAAKTRRGAIKAGRAKPEAE